MDKNMQNEQLIESSIVDHLLGAVKHVVCAVGAYGTKLLATVFFTFSVMNK